MGFHFTYFTEQYSTEKKETYIYCYEYGYKLLSENKLLVVKDTRKRSFKQKLALAKTDEWAVAAIFNT